MSCTNWYMVRMAQLVQPMVEGPRGCERLYHGSIDRAPSEDHEERLYATTVGVEPEQQSVAG
jgi:hypothetical protein